MRRCILAVFLLLCFSPVFAEDMAVELRFDSKPSGLQSQVFTATVKSFRPIRIQAFSDTRSNGETYLGELKVNGQPRKIQSRTAVSVYATDAFRKVYDGWGGTVSPDAPLVLKGEITQFSLEETDGYLARVGFHFLLKDGEEKVLWDGHSSGIVKGTGRVLTAETLPALFNSLLREVYEELLEDKKLVGVWSGKVQNTYVIKDPSPSSPAVGKES